MWTTCSRDTTWPPWKRWPRCCAGCTRSRARSVAGPERDPEHAADGGALELLDWIPAQRHDRGRQLQADHDGRGREVACDARGHGRILERLCHGGCQPTHGPVSARCLGDAKAWRMSSTETPNPPPPASVAANIIATT